MPPYITQSSSFTETAPNSHKGALFTYTTLAGKCSFFYVKKIDILLISSTSPSYHHITVINRRTAVVMHVTSFAKILHIFPLCTSIQVYQVFTSVCY